MTKRKKYSKEFKLGAIALVKEQGYSHEGAARYLGFNPNMLGRWIKESESDYGLAFRGNGKLTPERLVLRQLREENKRLKMERDILKKSDGLLCKRNEIKYSFIVQHQKTWPIVVMCRLLGVTTSNHYSYQKRNQGAVDLEHNEMLE